MENEKKPRPPQITGCFLKSLLDASIRENALGDLEEQFLYNMRNKGKFHARWNYRLQLFPVLGSFFLNSLLSSLTLFSSSCKSALRHIKKGPVYFLITISGLILGMTCFITAMVYTRYERSFDRFFTENHRIFRVYSQISGDSGGSQKLRVTTPFPLAEALLQEYPEVENAAAVGEFSGRDKALKWEDRTFKARGISASPGFFDVFSFRLIRGNPGEVLSSPDSIILSQSLAEKIFRDIDPLGKQIFIDDKEALQVTGILQEIPENSHLHFDYITSLHKKDDAMSRYYLGWDYNFVMTYVKLSANSSAARLENTISSLGNRYLPESKKNTLFRLQSLTSIHLHPISPVDPVDTGDAGQIDLVILIGWLILAIACINATNLFTARASLRVKEIGLRKMHGAGRRQLIFQLLTESFIITLFSLGISILFAVYTVPRFSTFLGRGISLGILGVPFLGFLMLSTAAVVALGAGLYPAFVLSSPHLSDIIGKHQKSVSQRPRLRSLLVIGQFAAVIIFLLFTYTISRQLHYMQNRPLGFEKEHIVVMKTTDMKMTGKMDELSYSLQKQINVHETSLSMPPAPLRSSTSVSLPGKDQESFPIYKAFVDYNFLEFFGIELLGGRFFSREFGSDETQKYVVLNQAASGLFDQTDLIGQKVSLTNPWGEKEDHEVIGIMGDFHSQPLHQPISPVVLELVPQRMSDTLCLKIDSQDVFRTLSQIEASYAQFSDPSRLNFFFLDESINAMYTTELRLRAIVRFFSTLSILIAGLGLYGLAAHAAERKTKEIGIRKVIGASVFSIIRMLNGEFVRWVLLANLFAWPIAYYLMQSWLRGFAYRISLPAWIFPIIGCISLFIALATISSRSYLAARKNPVESIRYE